MGAIRIILIVILSLAVTPGVIHAADVKDESQSLDALADDLKFQNGVGFLKIKKYNKALETFNEYLEIYYNGTHRHEVYRHIAEIYFNRMEYMKAIDNYRALYEEFSNTESGIEAYFNIGICHIKMGNEKKAAEIFNDIVENHADSAYRQQAELQLSMIDILQE
ncbi:MAG: tetratricopeptide repeat protein [Spirochaetes bacterium]|nr:tetratricopeptide repeat protein [Spirochaetota bacterium]